MTQRWGVGSTVAPLRRVFARSPATQGDFAGAQWRIPDPVRLVAEHEAFVELLRSLRCEVEVGEPTDSLVDAVYTHDPVLMTPHGAVLLRMRKPVRATEPEQLAADLDRLGVPMLGRLDGDAYADGGDKVWFDERTLAVGHGYRTNAAGIAQLSSLLAPYGVDVVGYDLPHFRGPRQVLHLMSVVSPIADDLAVVYEPLAPVRLLEFLDRRGVERVPVDDDEFETQGGNVLAVRPRVAVLAEGNGKVAVRPRVAVLAEGNGKVAARLRAAGCAVHEYAGTDLCVKGDGGPTCLTQPLWRQ